MDYFKKYSIYHDAKLAWYDRFKGKYISIEEQPDVVNEIYKLTGIGNVFQGGVDWYTHEEDMKKISKKFPYHTFNLLCISEMERDIWKKVFRNGDMLLCKGKVVYEGIDDFDDVVANYDRAIKQYGTDIIVFKDFPEYQTWACLFEYDNKKLWAIGLYGYENSAVAYAKELEPVYKKGCVNGDYNNIYININEITKSIGKRIVESAISQEQAEELVKDNEDIYDFVFKAKYEY